MIAFMAGLGFAAPNAVSAQGQPQKPTGVVWVGILVVYAAPSDAVNWHGPWVRGKVFNRNEFFATEGDCDRLMREFVDGSRKIMLAPIRFKCVSFPESLSGN